MVTCESHKLELRVRLPFPQPIFDTKQNTFMTEEPFMKMDGYEDCIVGVVEQFGRPHILCYDKRKILAKLIDDGMSYYGAEEFFEYNQIGAYVGESTPCFVTLMTENDKHLFQTSGIVAYESEN